MRKIWKVTASALATMFCFTGLFACDGDKKETKKENDTVAENYTEVTTPEQKQTLTSSIAAINVDTLLGNAEAADWARSVTFAWENAISYSCGDDSASANGSGKMNLWLKNDEEEDLDIAAALETAQILTFSQSMMENTNLKTEGATKDAQITLAEKAYFDMVNLYFDTDLKGENCDLSKVTELINGKQKIAVQDIMDIVSGMIGGTPDGGETDDAIPTSAALTPVITPQMIYAATIVNTLDAFKVKISADYSDGLKVKLETSDETWSLLEAWIKEKLDKSNADVDIPAWVITVLDSTKVGAEAYVHISQTGELKEAALKLTVSVKADLKKTKIDEIAGNVTAEEDLTKLEAVLSFNLSVGETEVTLPANLAEDTDYVLIDIKEIVGGMIGGENE